jgi:Mrp family chromosome partitioning ATPase
MSEKVSLARAEDGFTSSFGRYLGEVFAQYVTFTECKRLVSQVSALQNAQHFRILAITSELRGEGKSFVVLSLAYGYATLRSKRVLVVDASAQTVGRMLFLEHVIRPAGPAENRHQGPLLDILSTRSSDLPVVPESSDFELIPYVRSISENYDLVLVDTCALRQAAKENVDPVIVAGQSDAVIIVTSPRCGGTDVLGRLKQEIEGWKFKLIGTVFNRGVRA